MADLIRKIDHKYKSYLLQCIDIIDEYIICDLC